MIRQSVLLRRCFVALLLFGKIPNLMATTFDTTNTGSDTNKALVVTYTPTLDGSVPDRAKGTVDFTKGFAVINGPVHIDLNLPVNGTIFLDSANAKIILDRDLYLGENAYIKGSGAAGINQSSIDLQGHTIFTEHDLSLETFAQQIAFVGGGTLDGQGNSLQFNGGTLNIELEFIRSYTLKNITVENPTTSFFPMTNCTLTLDNVIWRSGTSFTFDPFRMFFKNDVQFVGNAAQITFHIDGSSSILSSSRLYFGPNVYSAWKILPPGLRFADFSSELFFDNNGGLSIFDYTEVWRHGTVIFNGTNAILYTSYPSETLSFGDGNPNNDMNIIILPGAELRPESIYPPSDIYYNNTR